VLGYGLRSIGFRRIGLRPGMDPANPHTRWLRFSLREVLLVLAFVALGCAALKYAGGLWLSVLSAGVLLLFMGAAVVAAVDRGHRQAKALGFALCMAIYGILFWSAPATSPNQNPELDPHAGSLPTSKALAPLFSAIVKRSYHDLTTGQEVAPPAPPHFVFSGYVQETPDRGQFMATGHLLWTVLLGYFGSRLGLWAYTRRLRSQES
jgi:hypothetical protein